MAASNLNENQFSYRGGHTAPSPAYGARMHALDELVPADIYDTKVQRRYYGSGGGDPDGVRSDTESFRAINAARGRPEAPVTVHRAVPKAAPDEINPGDWVTPSRHYARWHGESNLGNWDRSGDNYVPDYKVISRTVPARELHWDGNSVNEFGWHPE